jgi:hypothetical protein
MQSAHPVPGHEHYKCNGPSAIMGQQDQGGAPGTKIAKTKITKGRKEIVKGTEGATGGVLGAALPCQRS